MKTAEIRAFRKQLRRFERLLNNQLKSCCSGVTLAQCHALMEIEEQGETTTGLLSEIMDLDKSTLSRTIDGLVNVGLVERLPHPSDRRITLLSLTTPGREICRKLNEDNDAYVQEVFDRIPEENREGAIEHLELLIQAMSTLDNDQERNHLE